MKLIRVLGIETTCDETAVAIVSDDICTKRILAQDILSQITQHAAYGGVVPEIAARAHIDVLDSLVRHTMEKAGLSFDELDAIAASAGPGLIGGVLVGAMMAKGLALSLGKPFIPVNHLEAHALTARLTNDLPFPYLLLLASGGHTQILYAHGVGKFERLGTSVDDAIGEAFDKVAKMLGLAYPGGPQVEEWARHGNPERFALPRPMMGREKPDFSLSGLKTAVRMQISQLPTPLQDDDIADICASFQAAVIDVIVDRLRMALRKIKDKYTVPSTLVIAGGVAANQAIARSLERFSAEIGIRLCVPPPQMCTDNAAMVAWAGLEHLRIGHRYPLSFAARPRWPVDEGLLTPENA